MSDRPHRSTRRSTSSRARISRTVAVPVVGAVALAACGTDPVTWAGLPEVRLPAPAASAAAAPDAAADSLVRRIVESLQRDGWTRAAATFYRGAGKQVDETIAFRVAPPVAPALATLPPDPAGTRCPLSLRVAAAPATAATPAAVAGHAAHAGTTGTATGDTTGGAMAGMTASRADASTTAGAGGAGAAAVWWTRRPDGSAALYLSRTADAGRSWSPPLAVDTLDRSEGACDRPAPSVAVDSVNGYLHVAYSMRAPEGQGVFYAHQMDPRGPFERPQVIVYGDRPAATSVTSAGDRVVVAYEDPNTGGRPFVSLALSRTAGHSWAERVPVSETNVAAERPVVALRGADQVVLGWVERSSPRELTGTDDPRSAVTALPSGIVVRIGRLHQ